MTVEILETGTILVSMSGSDMREYSLDLSARADSEETRRGLTVLLFRIGEICGADSRGRSWLVEALPAGDGCLLVITARSVRRRKIYRIKRENVRPVCVFYDSDAMLDFLGAVPASLAGYSVYLYSGRYHLIPELYSSESALKALSEYGSLRRVSRVAEARLREFGELIVQRRNHRASVV